MNDNTDDDFIGFVFSYQSDRRFYAVVWKKAVQSYWEQTPFKASGVPGITLKLINSKTGPGEMLRNSLWHNESVTDQTEVLWSQPGIGWQENSSYRWLLNHRYDS